jgi:hypothetical protein
METMQTVRLKRKVGRPLGRRYTGTITVRLEPEDEESLARLRAAWGKRGAAEVVRRLIRVGVACLGEGEKRQVKNEGD